MDPSGRDINLDFDKAIPLNKAARKADKARKAQTPKAFRGARY